jgi:hypothetical protein
MAKVHSNDGVGAGGKRVLPVEWQEAVPFALELKERWSYVAPAIPERVRYLELQEPLPDGDGEDFGRCRATHDRRVESIESKVTIIHAFGESEDDE